MNKIIPNGWKSYSIKEIGTVITGSTPPKKDPENYGGDLPWIKPPDLDNEMFVFNSSETISEIGREKVRLLPKGTVLVSCIGNIGKIAIAGKELCTNQQINSIIPNEKIVDSIFLFFTIRRMQPYLQKMASKAVVPLLNKTDFLKIIINLPPLPTQKKIVAILEKAEKLKGWRREADELTDEFLKSTFLEMFGDPVKNPNEWNIKKLGDICRLIKDGPHVSPNYTNKGIPFITVHNIINGFFDLSNVRYISETDHNEFCKRCKPEKGDVLYTKGGTTGFAKRIEIDFEFSIWVHLALLKFPKELLNDVFLEACLNSNYCKVQAKRYTRGIANRDLVLSQIAKIKIIVPPIEIQQKFADFVEKIELMQEHQTQSRQHIYDLFNALMQQAFRGEFS